MRNAASIPTVTPVKRTFYRDLILLVAAGSLLGLPCLWFGFPYYGDDSITVSVVYTHFAEQLWKGDPYPRWLSGMNGGLGSIYFFYYGPIPHYLTSALRIVLPNDPQGWYQLGYAAVGGLIGSGIGLYWWIKNHVRSAAAVVAAVLYMALPYHLHIDLYSRAAYGEFWAFVWMPLTLWAIDRGHEQRRLALLSTALIYALLIATHLPITLIFSCIPLGYAWFFAKTSNRRMALSVAATGMSLGVGLSAVYLLPAIALQRFSFLTEGIIGHYFFAKWFLVTGVNWTGSRAALFWFTIEVAALAGLAFTLASRNATSVTRRQLLFWTVLSAIALFMMTPLSKPFWSASTELQKIQFPWRFNAVLSLAASALVGFALDSMNKWTPRAITLHIALLLLGGIWLYDLAYRSWYSYPVNYIDLQVVTERNKKLEQRREDNEFRTRWLVSLREKDLETLLQRVGKSAGSKGNAFLNTAGTVELKQWDDKRIVTQVDTLEGGVLTVSQFYFPGWVAHAGGPLDVGPSIPGGLVNISVPAGKHEVVLRRTTLTAEKAGLLISAVSGLLALFLMIAPYAGRYVFPCKADFEKKI